MTRSPRCASISPPKCSSPQSSARADPDPGRARSRRHRRSTRCGSPASRPNRGRRAPRPNPLLPLAWQRERDVPRATARSASSRYARALTAQLARAAPEVVFSLRARTPTTIRASRRRCCPPATSLDERSPTPRAKTARRQFAARPRWSAVVDDRAPALPREAALPAARGSIEAQSDCPFKAVARLSAARRAVARTDRRPVADRARQAAARALAAFWRDVRPAALAALVAPTRWPRGSRRASTLALQTLASARRRALPPLCRAGESTRLAASSMPGSPHRALAAAVSRPRGRSHAGLTLQGLAFRLRLDRVDALADGGTRDHRLQDGPNDGAGRMVRSASARAAARALRAGAARRGADATVRARGVRAIAPGEIKVRGPRRGCRRVAGAQTAGESRRAGLADWAAS